MGLHLAERTLRARPKPTACRALRNLNVRQGGGIGPQCQNAPMSGTQRLVALAVILLAVAAAVVVGLNIGSRDGQASATPMTIAPESASATPSESAPPASDQPEASAPTDDEALAIFTEIEAQVEAIRGLPSADIGAPDVITRAELAVELEQLLDEDYPTEEREQDNVVLRAFGLLEPEQDIAELQLQLLGEGVVGFYDDEERRMVVATDAGLDAAAKLTYAHEYTHALQDAAFGIDSLERDVPGEDDRGLARTALLEGDAQATSLAWAFQHLTQAEILELQQIPLPDYPGIPGWMVAQIEFPYLAGQAWVTRLAGGNPLAPDFTAVDAAFADPPDTSEQIIDFAKWRAREPAIPVEVPDLAAALGADWEHVDTSPVGQATIAIILEFFGVDPPTASVAGDGWGGDRATVAQGPNGEWALAWRLAWDAPEDATEFVEAYEVALTAAAFDFPASIRALPSGEVLVVHASTQALHDSTVTIAGD